MELDYEKIGLKCGLEIHQQLDTSKLFCNCPSLLRQSEPDFTFNRKLHAVAGESGEVDVAAAYQVSLDREFLYQGYDSVCLVELDEEPPHQINKEALKTVLQIAILLNAKIFPLTQIMRKTVVDGSNTSGFQRTVLIARDGYVDTKYGRVRIDSVCLEEDSSRIVGDKGNLTVYNLDRLGIPLIEIATSPDIKNPKQAKEVALFIGNILRSCKIKRGLGTIRQDVNVSIKKGARVEIKGVQKPELIEKAVEKEAERQANLIESNEKVESEVRKVLPDGETEFLRPMPGSARMYPETDLPLLKLSRDLINNVKKTLPRLKSETEKELREKGLSEDMIKLLFRENKVEEFKELLKILDRPTLVAKILLIFVKEISKKENISVEETEDNLPKFVGLIKSGKISESHVKEALRKFLIGENPEDILSKKEDNIEEKVHKIIKEKPGLSENAYMGLVMKEFKGKISGKEAMEIIKKYIK
jgi:Glu-tRNA(Gln) amidotransferase subunit E-like FAD-binding protein